MSPQRPFHRRVNKHMKTLHCACNKSYTRADHFERHKQKFRHSSEHVVASESLPDFSSSPHPFNCSCGTGFTAAHSFIRHCRKTGHDGDWARCKYQSRGYQDASMQLELQSIFIDLNDDREARALQHSLAPSTFNDIGQSAEHQAAAHSSLEAIFSDSHDNRSSSVTKDDEFDLDEIMDPADSSNSRQLFTGIDCWVTPIAKDIQDPNEGIHFTPEQTLMSNSKTSSAPVDSSPKDNSLEDMENFQDLYIKRPDIDDTDARYLVTEHDTSDTQIREKLTQVSPLKLEISLSDDLDEGSTKNDRDLRGMDMFMYDSDFTDDEDGPTRQLLEETAQARSFAVRDRPHSLPTEDSGLKMSAESRVISQVPMDDVTQNNAARTDVELESYASPNSIDHSPAKVTAMQSPNSLPKKHSNRLRKYQASHRSPDRIGISRYRRYGRVVKRFFGRHRGKIGLSLLAILAGAGYMQNDYRTPTFAQSNGLGWLNATAVKYITRDGNVRDKRYALYEKRFGAHVKWSHNWNGGAPPVFLDGKMPLHEAIQPQVSTHSITSKDFVAEAPSPNGGYEFQKMTLLSNFIGNHPSNKIITSNSIPVPGHRVWGSVSAIPMDLDYSLPSSQIAHTNSLQTSTYSWNRPRTSTISETSTSLVAQSVSIDEATTDTASPKTTAASTETSRIGRITSEGSNSDIDVSSLVVSATGSAPGLSTPRVSYHITAPENVLCPDDMNSIVSTVHKARGIPTFGERGILTIKPKVTRLDNNLPSFETVISHKPKKLFFTLKRSLELPTDRPEPTKKLRTNSVSSPLTLKHSATTSSWTKWRPDIWLGFSSSKVGTPSSEARITATTKPQEPLNQRQNSAYTHGETNVATSVPQSLYWDNVSNASTDADPTTKVYDPSNSVTHSIQSFNRNFGRNSHQYALEEHAQTRSKITKGRLQLEESRGVEERCQPCKPCRGLYHFNFGRV